MCSGFSVGLRLDKLYRLAYRTWPSAQIAQLVEQRIENPRVAGSIPALGTIFSAIVSDGYDEIAVSSSVKNPTFKLAEVFAS